MASDVARIRIKVGQIEVEYEGAAGYLKDDLLLTFRQIVETYKEYGELSFAGTEKTMAPQNGASLAEMSTTTVASHLGVKSGTDLVMAAAAHLTLVQGQEKMSRKELHDEMRSASVYYKSSYGSNLSKSLKTLLTTKRLHLSGKDLYALPAAEKKRFEEQLAQY